MRFQIVLQLMIRLKYDQSNAKKYIESLFRKGENLVNQDKVIANGVI